jgi:hypothetical protein
MTTEQTATEAPAVSAAKPARKPAKKAAKQAKPTAKLVKKADPKDGTPLKSICAKLRIEPRLARRKLRAANLAFHGKRERWTFTPAQAAKATEILRA